MVIFKKLKFQIIVYYLLLKFKIGRQHGTFWDWILYLATDDTSFWHNNWDLIFYLLVNAINERSDYHLCLLFNQFKKVFLERNTPKKYIDSMQEACKRINTPNTVSASNERLDWANIDSIGT